MLGTRLELTRTRTNDILGTRQELSLLLSALFVLQATIAVVKDWERGWIEQCQLHKLCTSTVPFHIPVQFQLHAGEPGNEAK